MKSTTIGYVYVFIGYFTQLCIIKLSTTFQTPLNKQLIQSASQISLYNQLQLLADTII